ncbi:hypothetical protein L2E82_22300 [Cichorium intybus]|uniref:Uncharacterized protein n=1 Tax=Cichorium intybus TaxID=13427 RepID=A0ACB9DXE6_CICIN|nr:hypothetical protein L2E82_22300 [Cichorium intybus]
MLENRQQEQLRFHFAALRKPQKIVQVNHEVTSLKENKVPAFAIYVSLSQHRHVSTFSGYEYYKTWRSLSYPSPRSRASRHNSSCSMNLAKKSVNIPKESNVDPFATVIGKITQGSPEMTFPLVSPEEVAAEQKALEDKHVVDLAVPKLQEE